MKKLILILILSAGFSQLKAQQAIQVSPVAPLTNGLNNAFKPNNSITPNQLLVQPKADITPNIFGLNSKGTVVYSNMPVAGTRSNDRMPIAKLQGNSDNMPVLKVTIMHPGDPAQTPAP
jgi:hypothetical protein